MCKICPYCKTIVYKNIRWIPHKPDSNYSFNHLHAESAYMCENCNWYTAKSDCTSLAVETIKDKGYLA